jgi:hypothetical protein
MDLRPGVMDRSSRFTVIGCGDGAARQMLP